MDYEFLRDITGVVKVRMSMSLSLCGVEDFLQVVAAYREFMQQR